MPAAVALLKRWAPPPRYGWPLVWLALAAGYAAYYWSNPVGITPDSRGYLEFSGGRTAGYPLFLDAVLAVFGTVDAVPKVQLGLAALSFAFLGWSVHRAFGGAILAVILVLLLFDHNTLAGLHATIGTESTFVSLLCVMAGGLALLAGRPRWQLAAVSAFACGLAIMVRPAALSLLPIWPLALWFVWGKGAGQRTRLLAAVVVPLLLCFLAENAVWHLKHDAGLGDRPLLANRHVFAKALVLGPEPVVDAAALALAVDAGRTEMAPARALIAGAPDWRARTLLLRQFEVAAQYPTDSRVSGEELRAIARRRGVTGNELQGDVGWAAMFGAPGDWLANALTHYRGLWSAYWLFDADSIARYEAYTAGLDDSPLFREARVFDPLVESASWPPWERLARFLPGVESLDWLPTVNTTRWKQGAGLLASALAIMLAPWQRLRRGTRGADARLAVAALAGLAVHGHFLLIGLTGVATPRYAHAMWPLMALCVVLVTAWALERAREWWNWSGPRFPAVRRAEPA